MCIRRKARCDQGTGAGVPAIMALDLFILFRFIAIAPLGRVSI